MKNFLTILGGAVLAGILVALILYPGSPIQNLGSVGLGGEYFSTTTGGNMFNTPSRLLINGPGALGSVVITGANTGIVHFYDATTTNYALRTGQRATTSIYIGSLPTNLAAGTYTFDVNVVNGLYMDWTGNLPTSTVTWHQF